MAYDLKHTKERVSLLKENARTLNHLAKLCEECQKYHDTTTDWVNRADNVDGRMAAIQATLNIVINQLTDLNTNENMAFQYEWVAGRQGIEDILVRSTGETVTVRDRTLQVRSSFTNALSATDRITLIDSVNTSSTVVVSALDAGASIIRTNPGDLGGDETLLSRIIKEMGGE